MSILTQSIGSCYNFVLRCSKSLREWALSSFPPLSRSMDYSDTTELSLTSFQSVVCLLNAGYDFMSMFMLLYDDDVV